MRFFFPHQHRFHEPPGAGRGPGHHHFGFRGGRQRMFEQGDLRLVILKLLSDKPSYGYEIIKAVEDRFGGNYAPSPGVVYPTLTLLEELGQIRAVETDGARKLFGITEEGRAVMEAARPDIDRIFMRMEEMRAKLGGDMSPKIRRGMENVRTALKLRLERGPITDADAARIAEALDAVAKAIEA